jgi:hypothetical protein
MDTKRILIAGMLVAFSAVMLRAEGPVTTLHGTCVIGAAEANDSARLKLDRGDCNGRDCHNQEMDRPWGQLTGFTLTDLRQDGKHADARITSEAGTLTCSGTVRDLRLSGEYSFVPDEGFVKRMNDAGFRNLNSEKLEAYTLFDIRMAWIESLQQAGITGLDSDNLIALRIFRADAGFVRSLVALGYPVPPADKLIALRVQGVDPEEVRQVRALGLQPNLDELIQMRIFRVTPDFIKRMQSKGLNDLTIAKLVQIRIFNLAE